MDMDMQAFLEEVAEVITAPPPSDAPADYLHRRAEICAAALRVTAAGEHPADALEEMEEQLGQAAQPVEAVALPTWRGEQLVTAP